MKKTRILEIVAKYLQRHPAESERLRVFTDYLESNDELFDRKNFQGHITTSAIVFDPAHREILLISHKTLNRFLQPGGHFEGDASLAASAAREVLEETGVTIEPHPTFASGDLPIDIDAHWMPANPRKQEDGHYHFDFRYLFTSSHGHGFDLQEEEVTDCGWYSIDSEETQSCFGPDCWPKLRKIQEAARLPAVAGAPGCSTR
jgi:8-oxo-dGTP pyrophosphatase MutT (NUDIX family)